MFRILMTFFFLCVANIVTAQNDTTGSVTLPDGRVFNKVDVEATFPGGDGAWRNFLQRNLNGNIPVKNGAPIGQYTVIVRFIVNKTGKLSDISVETNNGYGTEEEVIRIIKKSGDWIPAAQNGRNVNAYRRQPITFAVEDDNLEFTTPQPFIFFVGKNNTLEIKSTKVKSENLEVTISKGTIKQVEEGRYIVQVSTPGRVEIEVFNAKKKNKRLGIASFEVIDPNKPKVNKLPPPPPPPMN